VTPFFQRLGSFAALGFDFSRTAGSLRRYRNLPDLAREHGRTIPADRSPFTFDVDQQTAASITDLQ
jgi:hypothetical protein